MLGCWFTTRRREVGIGYGWLLRGTYLILAVASAYIGFAQSDVSGADRVRDVVAIGVGAACLAGLAQSIVRRRFGVSGHTADHDRRTERIAQMTGIEREVSGSPHTSAIGREFTPVLDLVPALIGLVGLVAAGVGTSDQGIGTDAVAVARTLVGAVFLGFVSDAMLLGHWYLVQPGLPRRHVNEIVRAFLYVWPVEVVMMLLPTGMFSVFSGSVDDGWGGQLGWFWVACAVTTGVLTWVTLKALQEKAYSAVMAATGLMYLAILTAFGTDLVARAVLSG